MTQKCSASSENAIKHWTATLWDSSRVPYEILTKCIRESRVYYVSLVNSTGMQSVMGILARYLRVSHQHSNSSRCPCRRWWHWIISSMCCAQIARFLHWPTLRSWNTTRLYRRDSVAWLTARGSQLCQRRAFTENWQSGMMIPTRESCP